MEEANAKKDIGNLNFIITRLIHFNGLIQRRHGLNDGEKEEFEVLLSGSQKTLGLTFDAPVDEIIDGLKTHVRNLENLGRENKDDRA